MNKTLRNLLLIAASGVASQSTPANADVRLPALFTNNMVLQQGIECPVWGWADPGEEVTVSINGKSHKTKANKDGAWKTKLQILKGSNNPTTLAVAGKNSITLENVVVGEVWVCSGQSNMQWPVSSSNDPDLESLTANYPDIRLITVPQVGTQEPQNNFNGLWEPCTPDTVQSFSGVGYFFGRQLHQTLQVPVGLIDNSWGGSACEAWIRRDLLDKLPSAKPYMEQWAKTESTYDDAQSQANYQKQLDAWKENSEKAKLAGKPEPSRPRAPRNPLTGQHRPANLYNGVLKPIIGYGIKGTIWYQGESNSGRAKAYRDIFPLMIKNWRDEWSQGNFPFYWVQLADFREESPAPADSNWAELREAQTLTLSQPNTGQAVITDLGEAHDIHPKDKQNVAKRLARWALAKDYGYKDLVYRSPQYKAHQRNGKKIILHFDFVGGGLDTFDIRTPLGFTLAGEDKVFHPAVAKIVGKDQVEVSSDNVQNPVAARYAWADNPVANVQNKEGLPLTPFRTDDFPMVTDGF
jgi:sialate O-acetylesterase